MTTKTDDTFNLAQEIESNKKLTDQHDIGDREERTDDELDAFYAAVRPRALKLKRKLERLMKRLAKAACDLEFDDADDVADFARDVRLEMDTVDDISEALYRLLHSC